VAKINTTKKDTPPKEGLDSLLQRIVTSFLFLIPNEVEKRNNIKFEIAAKKTPPIKKDVTNKIICDIII
jgi:hypothetical protein